MVQTFPASTTIWAPLEENLSLLGLQEQQQTGQSVKELFTVEALVKLHSLTTPESHSELSIPTLEIVPSQ